jgi:predicted N-acyltransferase
MFQSISKGLPVGVPVGEGELFGIQLRIETSIRAIGRDAWDGCFADEVEGYDCLLAIEEAGIEGFSWCYITLSQNGRTVAAMPAFITDYLLETTLEDGALRRVVQRARRYFPGFLKLKLACLGSPCTETGAPGFHRDVPAAERPALFARLLSEFQLYAKTRGCSLRGIKDVPEPHMAQFRATFEQQGFAFIPGLPTAWLDIDFDTIDTYMNRLSPGTRKDMRRKLKSLANITVETRSDLGHLLPRIMALYQETRNRSEWQFEALTPDYFTGILQHMNGRSFCTLYFSGDTLLAANILVHDGHTLIDKFFCMDSELGRGHNLYFLSWFTNLHYCLDHGMRRYQSGQAYYENKVRLGSQLTANTMCFKHRNVVVQSLLRLVSPLFASDDFTGKSP